MKHLRKIPSGEGSTERGGKKGTRTVHHLSPSGIEIGGVTTTGDDWTNHTDFGTDKAAESAYLLKAICQESQVW